MSLRSCELYINFCQRCCVSHATKNSVYSLYRTSKPQ